MFFSKIPSVLGFVSIKAATSSFMADSRASRLTHPWASDFKLSTLYPAITALAGLVPWAESGIRTFLTRIPSLCQTSPNHHHACQLTTGAGWGLQTDRIHSSDFSQQVTSVFKISRLPCTKSSGASGCVAAIPSSRATRSLIFGLYFIVQDPSGYMPASML